MTENQQKLLTALLKKLPERWSIVRPVVFPADDQVCETVYWFDDLSVLLKDWDKL